MCLKLEKKKARGSSNVGSRGMFPVRCQRDWFSVSSYLTLSLMAWKKENSILCRCHLSMKESQITGRRGMQCGASRETSKRLRLRNKPVLKLLVFASLKKRGHRDERVERGSALNQMNYYSFSHFY